MDSEGLLGRELDTLHDRGEPEIDESRQILKSIMDSANVWISVLDRFGSVTIWNSAAEKISGYSHEEVVGHGSIWEWLYPDEEYRSEALRRANSIIASRLREENLETKIRRKDGETRTVSWNFRAILDDNNRSIGSVALGLDMTEQVEMRNEFSRYSKHMEDLMVERTNDLRESEERLRAILDSSPYPITVSDLDGYVVDCNQALLRLHQYSSKDEIVGASVIILFAGKEHDTVRNRLGKALETGSSPAREYTFLTKDGREFPAEFSAAIVRDSAGKPVALVGMSRDLTEHYQYEDRLRKSERLAAIGETAAMVGHDLRNPLQGISGAAYILRQKVGSEGDPEAIEMLGLIESSLDHADSIIKELLEYSREIRLEPTETNAKAVIEAAMQLVKVPGNIKIKNLAGTTPSLQIDAAKTQRVFVNLIGNAVDAMPTGGELTITSVEDGRTLEVRLSDTGEGIPDEVMRNLWKPLKTTKPKGVGLGLAICKRIVEAHSGSIEVESILGKGTAFTIRLPLNHNKRSASPTG